MTTQPKQEEKTCKWKLINNGSMGFDEYVYQTECGKSFKEKFNYCPHCGGKIIEI